MLGKISA